MTSRKFFGSWKGSRRIVLAELVGEVLELSRVDVLQIGEGDPAEAGEQAETTVRSSSRMSAEREQHAQIVPMLLTSRRPSREATAMRNCWSPKFSKVSGISPIIPKSTKVRTQSRCSPTNAAPAAPAITAGRRRGPGHWRDEDVAGVRVAVEEAVV